MRGIFRRYRHLSAPQKRLYSLLAVITLIALLLYCLGLGGLLVRSRLVRDVALELPPTFTATPSPQSTVVTTPGPTRTPTATLPPTPTQRPIPTLTPTPESVNVTVVITSSGGLTSTMVVSATVTPTPVLTPTVTITAEASLSSSYLDFVARPASGVPMSSEMDTREVGLRPVTGDQQARDWTGFHPAPGEPASPASGLVGSALWGVRRRETPVRTVQYGCQILS